jgi:ABC-type lipoprotein export system ATPase subunit
MSRIKSFSIKNLFGYQDVDLTFENNIMILMGENGLGKTSILNSLYFTLTEKWNKLEKINFESITINIDEKKFKFTNKQLKWYLEHKDKRQYKYRNLRLELKNLIDFDDLNQFIDENINEKTDRLKIIYEYLRKKGISKKTTAPIGLTIELVDILSRQPDLTDFENLLEFFNDKNNNLNILYFPTYRRVEEELQNLGRLRRFTKDEQHYLPWEDEDEAIEDENLEDETLIQFGMEDVEQRILSIISKINETSIKGFAKVTGEMLHQLQEGFPNLTENEILKINSNNIEIILNRVKNNLSEADRKNILNLLDSKELLKKQELAYFLIKLEDIYLQQQHLDNAIKKFASVCNQYLVGKELFFDESSVTLRILNIKKDEEVFLNQLSSGEKQIVSLFSKLYLEDTEDLIIFFDEPELSLSIKWQKQLLPHVLETKRCSFLLAVTHSPFIFTNELERYAVSMNLFIN